MPGKYTKHPKRENSLSQNIKVNNALLKHVDNSNRRSPLHHFHYGMFDIRQFTCVANPYRCVVLHR